MDSISIKRILLTMFFLALSFSIYSQADNSDPSYKNAVNNNYSGNVNESGINGERKIAKKLDSINKEVDAIQKPEGWNELLNQVQIEQDKERAEQQKNDSIKKDLDYKAKVISIEKQKAENFKNKMIGYLVGIVVLALLIIILNKLFKILKGKISLTYLRTKFSRHNFLDIKKFNQKEILFISIGSGLITSIVLGSVFFRTKYFTVWNGVLIEVKENGVETHEFNYLLAIVCLISVSGVSYFYLNSKKKDI